MHTLNLKTRKLCASLTWRFWIELSILFLTIHWCQASLSLNFMHTTSISSFLCSSPAIIGMQCYRRPFLRYTVKTCQWYFIIIHDVSCFYLVRTRYFVVKALEISDINAVCAPANKVCIARLMMSCKLNSWEHSHFCKQLLLANGYYLVYVSRVRCIPFRAISSVKSRKYIALALTDSTMFTSISSIRKRRDVSIAISILSRAALTRQQY